MKVLLAEYIENKENLNVDVRMPYIKGFLLKNSIKSLYVRHSDKRVFEKSVRDFSPDLIVTNNDKFSSFKLNKTILSRDFQTFFRKILRKEVEIFETIPVFDADCYEEECEFKYVPHLVLSNTCNYSSNIRDNVLYKNIVVTGNTKTRGCSFCMDSDADVKWEIEDKERLKSLFIAVQHYLRNKENYEVRIIGEKYIQKPDRIFSLLMHLGIRNLRIIMTLRPEILIDNKKHFAEALTIASENGNKIILCSVGIESFYNKDLVLFNRYLDSKGVLKAVSVIYELKDIFRESLILNSYELFNFILFHPFTTMESIEYNLKMMKAVGINKINKRTFLNRLIANRNTAIYYLIKKEGLLITNDGCWRFKEKNVEEFYNRLFITNTYLFEIDEVLQILYDF